MEKLPHVGDTVRLSWGRGQQSKVKAYLANVKGGVVLESPLDGFKFWNKNDLVLVAKRNRTPAKDS